LIQEQQEKKTGGMPAIKDVLKVGADVKRVNNQTHDDKMSQE
jgi:hypothetical protein